MPPRCPECGRFLSHAFVEGLLAGPAPCPRCETTLEAEQFHGVDAAAAAPAPSAESIRPPDLPPEEVRPRPERDPLEGWDRGEGPTGGTHLELVERRTADIVAAPLGAALAIVGGGVLGGLVGGLATRQHRSVGAVIGTLAGASAVVLGARALGIPLNDDV